MLGYLAAAFAWGAIKASTIGTHRTRKTLLANSGLGELSEELEFRAGLERVLMPAMGLSPTTAALGSALAFGAAHPGLEVDAALGGLFYSMAWSAGAKAAPFGLPPMLAGLLAAVATHAAHNAGVHLGSKEKR